MRRGELLKSIDDTIVRERMVAPLFDILFHILSRDFLLHKKKGKKKKIKNILKFVLYIHIKEVFYVVSSGDKNFSQDKT